jgi:protein SCO1/2
MCKRQFCKKELKVKKQIVFIFLIVGLHVFACKDEHHHHEHNHDKSNIPASKASEGSLYELEEKWTTQSGTTITLADFKKEPILISMFYASCQSVCPRIVSDLQKLEKEIQAKSGKIPKIVLVSFDPEKDTKEVLQTYVGKMKLGDNWTLLNGTNDSVRMLSVVLGINYQKTETGDFNHSTVISLISSDGKIETRVEGIGADKTSILKYFK